MREGADPVTAPGAAAGATIVAPTGAARLAPFAFALVALLAYVAGLDRAGWTDAGALALQHAVERLRDADGPRLSLFGLLHPHVPVAIVWALQALPGLDIATAQLAAAVVLGAWTMARWHRALARAMPVPLAWAVLALVLANPWVGWALTASLPSALALAAFLGLCFAVIELVDDDAPQALMRVAGWLLLMFFVDARAVWVALALAPMFALVRPRARAYGAADRVAEPAPLGAILLVVYLPLLFAFGSWCYVNWLFAGDPLHWIATDAARGADELRHALDTVAAPDGVVHWLLQTGGAALLLAAAFPVAGLLVLSARQGARRAGWALAMVPVFAALLAAGAGGIPEPAQVLSLAAGTVLAGLSRVPAGGGSRGARAGAFRVAMLGLLALGAVAAWALALQGPTALGGAGLRGWVQALAGDGRGGAVASTPPKDGAGGRADVAGTDAAAPAAPTGTASPAGRGDARDAAAVLPRDALAQALAQWAEAWSDRRIDDYLAFYDEAFETPEGITRERWHAQRRERLSRSDPIRLRLDAIEISVDGAQGRTRFVQTWSVPGRTMVDRKALRWVLRDGQWRIVRERATPVAAGGGASGAPAGAPPEAAAPAPAGPAGQ